VSAAKTKAASAAGGVMAGARAVLYLRVSDPKQVHTDYDPEGNSIPAQRKACEALAKELGLDVVDEYVEPGRSAKSIDRRPQFQAMMERVRARRDVEVIVIYMRSRIFRNAADAALTRRELKTLGVSLLSVKDPTADTISGDMLAGILDVVNEYQSKAAGDDIAYKMEAKAQRGGTPNKTRLGYLNVAEHVDGRQVRTVAIDPVRGPLVRMLFERYATGQYTFASLRETATAAGLRTRPTRKFPAGTPLSIHAIGRILKDRYYLGKLPYKGREYEGRHEPLITAALFDRVQEMLHSQRQAGIRERRWNHFLKGTVRCARCKRRLTLERAKSKTGRLYFYYLCLGRADHECDLPRLAVEAVEEHVMAHWATIAIAPSEADEVRAHLADTLDSEERTTKAMRDQLKRERARLEAAEDQCVELIGNPDWPADKLTAKVRDLRTKKAAIDEQLDQADAAELTQARQTVETLLAFLADPKTVYRDACDADRKLLNQICFNALYLDRDAHGLTIDRTDLGTTAAPLVNQVRSRRARNGAVPEDNAASENGFHKPQGSETEPNVREGGLEPPRP
jgi:DNA invertase Pin-like site-specific DNA recombinase